jgi:hypothetical protein
MDTGLRRITARPKHRWNVLTRPRDEAFIKIGRTFLAFASRSNEALGRSPLRALLLLSNIERQQSRRLRTVPCAMPSRAVWSSHREYHANEFRDFFRDSSRRFRDSGALSFPFTQAA